VIDVLSDQLILGGVPEHIRSDNGSDWLSKQSMTVVTRSSASSFDSLAEMCRSLADNGCKLANVALDVSARMSARMAVRHLVEAQR
jgi:hypothetical protein